MLFEDLAKEVLRRQIWQVADFSGVEVIAYCVMGNHFHVLVRVPDNDRIVVSDEELMRRYRVLYPKPTKYQPARAGIARDPKQYRWSGYGEAVGGSARARRGFIESIRELGNRGVVTFQRNRLCRGSAPYGGVGAENSNIEMRNPNLEAISNTKTLSDQ